MQCHEIDQYYLEDRNKRHKASSSSIFSLFTPSTALISGLDWLDRYLWEEVGTAHCLSLGELSQPLAAPCPRDVPSRDRSQALGAVTQEKEKRRLEEWGNVPEFCHRRPGLLLTWSTHHRRKGSYSHHLGFKWHISIKNWHVIYFQQESCPGKIVSAKEKNKHQADKHQAPGAKVPCSITQPPLWGTWPASSDHYPGAARALLAVHGGRRRCELTALGSLRCCGVIRDIPHLHTAQQRHWN